MLIYIGDGRDVIKRIRGQHLGGNVESSSLRKHIAIAMGYDILTTKRSSGSTRVRIGSTEPKLGERHVSDYLNSGLWQYVFCHSYDEANAFQWYAIETLQPLLNKDRRAWDKKQFSKFEKLLENLQNSQFYRSNELNVLSSGAGVYAFHQDTVPTAH